jgi:hypothetical protein
LKLLFFTVPLDKIKLARHAFNDSVHMSQINEPDFSSGSPTTPADASMRHNVRVRLFWAKRALCQHFWAKRSKACLTWHLEKQFRSDEEMCVFVRFNSAGFHFIYFKANSRKRIRAINLRLLISLLLL